MSDQTDLIVTYSLTVGLVLFETFKSGLKFTAVHKYIEKDGIKYTCVSWNKMYMGIEHFVFRVQKDQYII